MPDSTNDFSIAKFLPATLVPDAWMTDERLDWLAGRALDTENIRCERTKEGKLRIYPPTRPEIRLMVDKISSELELWITRTKQHGKAMIRRRFFLGRGLMLCPDVAYIHLVSKTKASEFDPFRALQICPSFVVEVCSHPRELRPLKEKMFQWIALGVELGWLMVPQEECVFVFTPGNEPEIADGDFVVGETPMEDFYLFLEVIWRFDALKRRY